MRVKEVTYLEARLVSTAQFENARIEIGMTVEVGEGELMANAFSYAKGIVRDELTARIMEMHEQEERDVKSEAQNRLRRKYKL